MKKLMTLTMTSKIRSLVLLWLVLAMLFSSNGVDAASAKTATSTNKDNNKKELLHSGGEEPFVPFGNAKVNDNNIPTTYKNKRHYK